MSPDASAPASNALPVAIQQAIQQAVGNVNDAADVTRKEKKDKKKKKRQREEDAADQAPVAEAVGGEDGEHERKRKKKKKKHDRNNDDIQPAVEEEVSGTDAAMQDRTLPEPVPPSDDPLPEAAPDEVIWTSAHMPPEPEPEKRNKKKKGKKDKGKGRAVEEGSQEPPAAAAAPTVDDTSSAEFLSAVVAAASATSGSAHHHPVPPPDFHGMPPPFPPYQGHFPYPPPMVVYPYPPGHPNAMYGHPPPPIYPDIPGLSLGDLSSEDLLRTLEDLDITKIASALKTLGDAAAANNAQMNIAQGGLPLSLPPGPPPVRQRPVKSDMILGRPPKPAKGASKRPPLPPSIATKSPEPGDEGNPDHAHMLANVWMNATKLAEMVKKQGLVYKKGKFSAIEEAQITGAIENYRSSRGLTKEQLTELIFSKDKGRDTFWPEITAAVHLRPIIAVYHYVRRAYNPQGRQGKWMPSEDEALRVAVAEHGQQWAKISSIIGRMDSDCRDRYRNHIQDRHKRQSGHWTKEEEEKLTQIVTEMTVQQGKDIDNDIFWGVVSEKMGGTRGRQQCRIKWTDSLSTQYKNQGERPRWSQMDAYLLVHKVDSLNVRDDSEIDWKLLPDEHWNSWSAHSLQRRWLTMKRSIKEIMDILRTKKAQSPPPPPRKKTKKFLSAEAIEDSTDDDGTPAPEVSQPAAGTSTGPGTAAADVGADSDSD
ncbi:RNA polymerase I enhancer binding protein [Steccherinum ochraceum]|uniref:RNA polymerase I enhancer binding protein n=1 Tax=Steccherinum ochraceum TaxID=92696 RepID=A0A4R0RW24_9APHY|nr:RNA polymerase I enhancer binding protein [Steccherinum ochraceum]